MRSSRMASLLAVTPLLAGAAVGAAGNADAIPALRACTPTWRLVDAPRPAGATSAHLTGVSVVSTKDVRFSGNVETQYPWVPRWDGRTFGESQPLPHAPKVSASVASHALSLSSATEGWQLVGGFDHGQSRISAARWHAGRWTIMPTAPSPDPLHRGIILQDVVSVSATDAWAVGMFYQADSGTVVGAAPTGAVIERWDGTRWSIVDNPAAALPGAYLSAVTAVTPTDVWAVGRQTDSAGTVVPLTAHFDGTQWRVVPAPTGSTPSALYGVSASGSRDVWAVGAQTRPGTGNVAAPLVLRWNGTQWSEMTGLPDIGNAKLRAVYAASPTRVWAVGEFPHPSTVVFLHWNGKSFQAVPVPGPQQYGLRYIYEDIDGTGPEDVWAVGGVVDWSNTDGGRPITPQVAHLSCGRR